MTQNETAPEAKGRTIRVAIVGVGNCASSLIQGRYYYENAKPTDSIPGLMHVQLGDYHISDVEFVAAFDVDTREGRQGPLRGDLLGPEQHLQVHGRARTWA